MDIQNEIWQDIFGRRQFGLNFADTKLVLTDSNFAVPTIETSIREVLFETYGFYSLQLASAPGLVAESHFHSTKEPYQLLLDLGHSFSHILPCLSGKICVERSMRIDVGGKIMTNFLRDKLTYSQIDLRQETKVVNEAKEDVCYFAKNFSQEMEAFQKNNSIIEYYLPDYNLLRRGQIKNAASDPTSHGSLTSISLGVERFVLPETIFCPEIIGCDQIGLKEAINRTSNGVFDYHLFGRHMLKNIIVFGGNAAIPGLKERLCVDLMNAFEDGDSPENIEDCIKVSANPITEPWLAAQYLVKNSSSFLTKFVSKTEYQEHGNRICDERFFDYAPKEWYDHAEDQALLDENGLPLIDSEDEYETITAAVPVPETKKQLNVVPLQSKPVIEPLPPLPTTAPDDVEIIEVITTPSIPNPAKLPRVNPIPQMASNRHQPAIRKIVVPQQRIPLIRCPEPPVSSLAVQPKVQHYITVSDGNVSRFIPVRPARIRAEPYQGHLINPSPSSSSPRPTILRIRSSSAIQMNPLRHVAPEMPILSPQISRQVPIMLPRGLIAGGGSSQFRGRTFIVRRAAAGYSATPRPQVEPSSISLPKNGLEEEYESGESGPSTPS